jgi:hypothetical protein
MRSLFLLLLGAAGAFAQPVGGGLKVGIPFTDFLEKASSGNINNFRHPKRYILGVTGELRLPFHLAIEVDALYRKMEYSGTFTGVNSIDVTTEGSTWEFPLLLKYRFGSHVARPFIDGGVAWNRLHGLTETVRTIATGGDIRRASNTTLRGLVLGAGIDVKLLFIHIQPEVRFTRWAARRYFPVGDFFDRNQSQAEFLLGISF